MVTLLANAFDCCVETLPKAAPVDWTWAIGVLPPVVDVDVDVEDAYFTGDEAPGGDNPTPDQDIVDEIGKSLGLVYEDDEELKGAAKLEERDRHRWELDPASSEDYDDRE